MFWYLGRNQRGRASVGTDLKELGGRGSDVEMIEILYMN